MPINREIQPRGGVDGECPPDADPLLGKDLALKWYERYVEAGKAELGMAIEGASYRASQAGSCLRRIQYDRLGLAESDPPTVADAWRFELGHLIHNEMQSVVKELYPNALIEERKRFNIPGEPDGAKASWKTFGATHIDLIVSLDEGTTWWVVEIKSLNGYAFKLAASTFRGGPEGPKFSHVRQLALEARAVAEDGYPVAGGVLVYLSTELLSPSLADAVGLGGELGRFVAEWRFNADELEVHADEQLAEFRAVEDAVDRGEFVERFIPEERGVVIDPDSRQFVVYGSNKEVEGGGTYWGCSYCAHRRRCGTHPERGVFVLENSDS